MCLEFRASHLVLANMNHFSTGTSTLDLSGPEDNGTEEVLHSPLSSKTRASPLDIL